LFQRAERFLFIEAVNAALIVGAPLARPATHDHGRRLRGNGMLVSGWSWWWRPSARQ
jgi:hypothetical protein